MKKIKPLEFACFIPFCIIGILIGINTQRTFNIAEEDAYISIILTIILGIIPIILFSYIHNYEKDLKINNKIEKLYGKYLTSDRLATISRESGVALPVALGILQHAGIIEWRQFSRYREKVMEVIPEVAKRG